MESFFELIKSRRSCRKFKSEKPDKSIIDKILQSCLMSPSSKSRSPWHFVLIDDQALLKRLSMSKPHGSKLIAEAPIAIVILADPATSDVWIEDTSIASINLQMAAEDSGLGSCWVQIRNRDYDEQTTSEKYIRGILNIPENMMIESIIALGYKDENKEPHDIQKLKKDRISYNQFKNKYSFD
ncbi:nitroreductase family protein [Saccharicrinis sp. FJH62]|uniref:nitroreductase family protein n=1 Tax=Saccharicrinis sp. FJH62 TaxID=3344657 RepID=UPI0035D3FF1F